MQVQPHIQLQETAVIRPINPSFHEDHVLSLSHIDTDRNLLLTLRYLRIYSNTTQQQQPDPFHVITTALSKALPLYYPFAGTLRRRPSDGRLELHCRVGDGLPVVNAVASCPLSTVDTDTITPFVEQLVPDPDPNEAPIRPMVLQITKFSCGGFVLGAAVHHAICDGMGATLFFNAVAAIARGSDRIGPDPVWDRSTLLGPRNPPRVEYPMHEVLSLDKEGSSLGWGKRVGVVKEYLNVEEEWLDWVKGELLKQSGLKFTTFEALGAYIWRARY